MQPDLGPDRWLRRLQVRVIRQQRLPGGGARASNGPRVGADPAAASKQVGHSLHGGVDPGQRCAGTNRSGRRLGRGQFGCVDVSVIDDGSVAVVRVWREQLFHAFHRKRIVEKGFTPRYDYALQTMQEIPYNRWREYDPEDTVRFYALRLHEIGLIKSTPQKIIAQGTDWRFLNELKRELKG